MADRSAVIAALMAGDPLLGRMRGRPYAPAPAPATPQGYLGGGNIDLAQRPNVPNPDGSISTVRSMSYGTPQGEMLIPTVSDEGQVMSDEDAMRYWGQKGQNLGVFRTPEEADAYAQKLHDEQAWFYGLK